MADGAPTPAELVQQAKQQLENDVARQVAELLAVNKAELVVEVVLSSLSQTPIFQYRVRIR
jgi:hypothetical protein